MIWDYIAVALTSLVTGVAISTYVYDTKLHHALDAANTWEAEARAYQEESERIEAENQKTFDKLVGIIDQEIDRGG